MNKEDPSPPASEPFPRSFSVTRFKIFKENTSCSDTNWMIDKQELEDLKIEAARITLLV